MIQKLWVEGRLPSYNEYIDACRSHKMSGSKFKKKWQNHVIRFIRVDKIQAVSRARFEFIWIEPNKKRNPDNISSFGRKVIFDALVQEEKIPNDGWGEIIDFQDSFYVSSNKKIENGGVLVVIDDLQNQNNKLSEQFTGF